MLADQSSAAGNDVNDDQSSSSSSSVGSFSSSTSLTDVHCAEFEFKPARGETTSIFRLFDVLFFNEVISSETLQELRERSERQSSSSSEKEQTTVQSILG